MRRWSSRGSAIKMRSSYAPVHSHHLYQEQSGQQLALHVLRRHRLVELFLVQVMGMDWSEVHSEAEQLEHVISADRDGIVRAITMAEGDVVREGYPFVFIEEADVEGGEIAASETLDPDYIRPDLQQAYDRHAYTLDENRPEAVAKRHARRRNRRYCRRCSGQEERAYAVG